ncbi:porin family protein [Rufibacter sediminis]|uniref:PorT family protein n=1 Tax=Rufibacter sediminis TaxID=2762756 RepID=A0ABR6VTA5_9BACT|nr:porin family protein [Rufibacter sediminis]MBC3540436.1 PorT family protein [Rufibacter sediminis]
MKKLLLFVAVLFTTYAAQAQDGIKLGVKAGANFSNWTGKDVEEAFGTELDYKVGYHVGVFLDYSFSDFVSLRPEVQLSNKGFKIDGDGDATVKAQVNYIDVPVLARINANGLFFEGGPTIGFKVSSKLKMKDGDNEASTSLDGIRTVDFGYAAGLGYELENGLGIGLRYNGGFSKISEDGEGKVYNSNIQLALSYILVRK